MERERGQERERSYFFGNLTPSSNRKPHNRNQYQHDYNRICRVSHPISVMRHRKTDQECNPEKKDSDFTQIHVLLDFHAKSERTSRRPRAPTKAEIDAAVDRAMARSKNSD